MKKPTQHINSSLLTYPLPRVQPKAGPYRNGDDAVTKNPSVRIKDPGDFFLAPCNKEYKGVGMKLLWMFLLGGVSALATADNLLPSDSNVSGPKYASILTWEEGLKSRFPELVTLVPYGTSTQGRPLQLILVRSGKSKSIRPTLLMSGSTHGSEYLNIEDRLPTRLLEQSRQHGPVGDFLKSGGAFVFVPIVNPDGYDTHRRENANGIDLNRDWDLEVAKFKGFKEKETRLLAETLERLRKDEKLNYSITVDYHCCTGALLYPWSNNQAPPLTKQQIRQFQDLGRLATSRLPVTLGTTDHLLGYAPLGTTKDYYFSRYGSYAFTYEGQAGQEPSRLEQHVGWWEDMTRWVLGTKLPVTFAQVTEALTPLTGKADE
jgi:hypothetical protein